MQRVYVITHPEATHHVDRLVGGWYDSHLTGHGRAQAERIARFLRADIPSGGSTQLVSSDLARTVQTANVIAGVLGVTPVTDPGLREKSYGVAEGQPQTWLDDRFIFPPAHGERLNHDEGSAGAETKREWLERAYAAVARIENAHAEHRVIVTHGGTATCVIAAWLRLPLDGCAYAAFRAPTGSVTILEEDDRFHNRTLMTLGKHDF